MGNIPDKVIDSVIPAAETIQNHPCAFCRGENKNKASGVLSADFGGNTHLWPICQECHGWASDKESGWVPICCTECGKAGWMRRKDGRVKVDESASVVFSQGCPDCSPSGSKHIWCL